MCARTLLPSCRFEMPNRGRIEQDGQKTGKSVARGSMLPKWPLVKLGRSGGVFSGKAMVWVGQNG